MLLFLEDYRDAVLRWALHAFLEGTLTPMQEHEFRGRSRMCNELVALQLADVLEWYGLVQSQEAQP